MIYWNLYQAKVYQAKKSYNSGFRGIGREVSICYFRVKGKKNSLTHYAAFYNRGFRGVDREVSTCYFRVKGKKNILTHYAAFYNIVA